MCAQAAINLSRHKIAMFSRAAACCTCEPVAGLPHTILLHISGLPAVPDRRKNNYARNMLRASLP
jgi:hypothetical protein